MGDRQRSQRTNVFVRGPVDEKEPAQQLLRAERRQLKGFVIACLRALLADPKGFLAGLEGHWPEERKPGRPKSPRT